MLAAPPVFKWPKSASGAKTIVSSKPIGRLFTARFTRPPETHGSRSSFQWRFLRKTLGLGLGFGLGLGLGLGLG